jgi:non-specific serine/threonine protein kinase
MGLGKTLQVIALLMHRRETAPRAGEGQSKPDLLVVPASLLGNWCAEIGRFAPGLRLWVAHPSITAKEELDRVLADSHRLSASGDVVMTTYALLQRSDRWVEQAWGLIVLDEAQAIKNAGSQVAQAVKRLRCDARVVLTGTPVENRPGDLWSLFDFLNPGLLGSAGDFQEAIKRCADAREGFGALRRLIQPYVLRRMKTDRRIIADLPEKVEVKAWCGLTKRQLAVYAKLVDQLAATLNDAHHEPAHRQGLVLGFLTKFKQICNHPSHWSGDGGWAVEDSGKFLRLMELAAAAAERREKMLVFTQFQELCAPLARALATVFQREGLVLHGGTPVKARAALVNTFQETGGPPFMVLSVKAGGTGLNLTAASQVVHFDRWWNPAVENQATDRAYRIGQQRAVLVHKMICQGTLEARIDHLLADKAALAEELLREGEQGSGFLLQLEPEALLEVVKLDVRQAML